MIVNTTFSHWWPTKYAVGSYGNSASCAMIHYWSQGSMYQISTLSEPMCWLDIILGTCRKVCVSQSLAHLPEAQCIWLDKFLGIMLSSQFLIVHVVSVCKDRHMTGCQKWLYAVSTNQLGRDTVEVIVGTEVQANL